MNLYLTKVVRGIASFGSILIFQIVNAFAKLSTLAFKRVNLLEVEKKDTTKEIVFLGDLGAADFSVQDKLNQCFGNPDAVFCYSKDTSLELRDHFYNAAALDSTVICFNTYHLGIAFFDVGAMQEKDFRTFSILRKLHRLRHAKADFVVAYVVDSRGPNGKLDKFKKTLGLMGFDFVIGVEDRMKAKQNFRTNGFGETRICYSLGRLLQKEKEKVSNKAGVAYRVKLFKSGKKTAVEKEGYSPLRVKSSNRAIEDIQIAKKAEPTYLRVEKRMKGFRNWDDLIYMRDVLKVMSCELPQKYDYLKDFSINQICARTYELAPGNIFIFRQAIHDKNDKKIESEFWRNRLVVRAFTRKSMFIFSYKKLLNLVPHMIIEDPMEAHIKLTAWYREKYVPAKYIGITGSIGKTSTKDMLYYVLRERYKTDRSKRNNNVQVKIALGMMNVASDCEAFVQEIGGGRKYGASRHSRMILPDATIVTNIGTAHLGNYESQLELMEHKLMITDGMKDDGVLFLNGDDALLWSATPQSRTVYYGVHNKEADYYADNIRVDDGITYFDIVHNDHRVEAKVHVLGEYNVLNAVCAYAVAKHFGMTDDEITRGLLGFKTTGIRQNLISVGGYRFFVDCYNASVASIGSSLSVLRQLNPQEGGKRIAVVGDVTGVGEFQEDIDREIADLINQYGDIDCVVCFGARANYIRQFLQRDGKETICIESAEEFKHWMTEIVQPEDVVMLKGSSKLKMDEKLDDYFGLNLSDQRYVDSSHYVLHRQDEAAYRIFAEYGSLFKYHGVESILHIPEQVMSKRVKKITDRAFANNEFLNEVHIGKNVLHIGQRAFANCTNLREVVFQGSVKYIEESAFENCKSLTKVTLDKSVIHIGKHAFRNCKNLKQISIPNTVGFIDEEAFSGCSVQINYV